MGLFNRYSKEAQFWRWFEKHSVELFDFEEDTDRRLEALHNELLKVALGLAFEFGPIQDEVRPFFVSAEGDVRLFPVVERLVAVAPKLPQWRMVTFRQPGPASLNIQYGDVKLTPGDIYFSAVPFDGLTDLRLHVRGLSPDNHKMMAGAVFILLDNAIGEYVIGTRLGKIDFLPLPDSLDDGGLRPLLELREHFGVHEWQLQSG